MPYKRYCGIKYILYIHIKYIYKGHYAADITIQTPTDKNTATNLIDYNEIKDFLETGYVGPLEAAYGILNKSMQDKSHTVIRLPVHLPNQHNVNIDSEYVDNALILAEQQITILIM